jgi:hypothetical protein
MIYSNFLRRIDAGPPEDKRQMSANQRLRCGSITQFTHSALDNNDDRTQNPFRNAFPSDCAIRYKAQPTPA